MSPEKPLQIYNTLTRKIEPVQLIEEGRLRMYACGPTVYSYAHIGNFRTFLTADLIVRAAEAMGWQTTYATNITDVGHLTEDDYADASGEDRMEKALRSREGERFPNVWDLARYYTEVLLEDWKSLNLREPAVRPRATEHITPQIEAIERLIASGYAYQTEKGVYFSVSSFPAYGKLSGNDTAEQLEQTVRDVVVDPEKRDPRDFALWKKDDRHLMQWYSPFGRGFPGWHIECSVMSMAYLGEHFDMHVGGEDLIFPHHECEIAQSESLTGKPFVNYWVHTRFLHVEGEKMSKSKGNFFTVRDLIAPEEQGGRGVHPLALRYALLAGKYREKFNFTHKNLRDSAIIVARYQEADTLVDEAINRNRPGDDHIGARLDAIYDETFDAIRDDLNTPIALAAALKGVRLIHGVKDLNAASARSAKRWLDRINALLGFIRSESPQTADPEADDSNRSREIETLIARREEARSTRDFERADAIRKELEDMGIEVMDTSQGPRWRKRVSL